MVTTMMVNDTHARTAHVRRLRIRGPCCRAVSLPLPRGERSANDLFSAPVAQLDRALPSEGRGRRFESSRARHLFQVSAPAALAFGIALDTYVAARQALESGTSAAVLAIAAIVTLLGVWYVHPISRR